MDEYQGEKHKHSIMRNVVQHHVQESIGCGGQGGVKHKAGFYKHYQKILDGMLLDVLSFKNRKQNPNAREMNHVCRTPGPQQSLDSRQSTNITPQPGGSEGDHEPQRGEARAVSRHGMSAC